MIRSTIKAGIKKALGIGGSPAAPPPAAPAWRADAQAHPPAAKPAAPAAQAAPPAEAAPAPAPVVEAAPAPAPAVEATPAADAAPAAGPGPAGDAEAADAASGNVADAAPAVDAAPAGTSAAPATDVIGPALTMDALQEVLDEMVRPALQGDGGDITLIKVEANDVYVKLVGSCSSCPSSIMTMKMGVEALLKEEFPSMGQLIQVS